VVGIRDGWKGLVKYDPRYPVLPPRMDFGPNSYARVLVESEVTRWDREGGTRLGSSRTNPFKAGKETWPQVVENVKLLGLEALVAIGGEDTLGIASKLADKGVNVVCIPKTIDGDLQGTDYTLGLETAVNVVVEEVDRLRSTAQSHSRLFVVETMGRYTGHLALAGGLAAGAPVILIPEVPFDVATVVEILKARKEQGHRYSIVVVAEGAKAAGGERAEKAAVSSDGFEHPTLGGIGKTLEKMLEKGTGMEVRSVQLSHLQRGGAPCAFDRRMGRLFGIAAGDLLDRGQYGRMVVYRDGKIASIAIPKDLKEVKKVDVEALYDRQRFGAKLTVLE
jgi:6-phosphofructokinase 1